MFKKNNNKSKYNDPYYSYHTVILKNLKRNNILVLAACIISFWSILSLITRYNKVPDFYVLSNPTQAPIVHFSDKGGVVSPDNPKYKLNLRDRLINNSMLFVYFYVNMYGANAAPFYKNLIPLWHTEYYSKAIRPLYIEKNLLVKIANIKLWSNSNVKYFEIIKSTDPYRVHLIVERIIQPGTNYQKIEYIELEIDWKEVPQNSLNYIGLAVYNMTEIRKEPSVEELEELKRKYPYEWSLNL